MEQFARSAERRNEDVKLKMIHKRPFLSNKKKCFNILQEIHFLRRQRHLITAEYDILFSITSVTINFPSAEYALILINLPTASQITPRLFQPVATLIWKFPAMSVGSPSVGM